MSHFPDNQNFCIGIDVGASSLKAGLVGVDGKIWAQRQVSISHESPLKLQHQIAQIVHDLRSADRKSQVKAIGIGLPALVSRKKTGVSISPGLPYLNGIDGRPGVRKRRS